MNYKKGTQTRSCMKSVMRYVAQENKTLWNGAQLISGIGCQPETVFDKFLSTKLLHHKDGGVMVTEKNWSALLEIQDRLFQQQMQLDASLKTILTREDAQDALTEMQMSAAEFERQAGSLSARYSSACKELTDSAQKSMTMILPDTKKQFTDTVQETRKKIRTCAWISITAVILCAALCSLAVLWSR